MTARGSIVRGADENPRSTGSGSTDSRQINRPLKTTAMPHSVRLGRYSDYWGWQARACAPLRNRPSCTTDASLTYRTGARSQIYEGKFEPPALAGKPVGRPRQFSRSRVEVVTDRRIRGRRWRDTLSRDPYSLITYSFFRFTDFSVSTAKLLQIDSLNQAPCLTTTGIRPKTGTKFSIVRTSRSHVPPQPAHCIRTSTRESECATRRVRGAPRSARSPKIRNAIYDE